MQIDLLCLVLKPSIINREKLAQELMVSAQTEIWFVDTMGKLLSQGFPATVPGTKRTSCTSSGPQKIKFKV